MGTGNKKHAGNEERLYHRLRNKYRMVIQNEETYEERFSLTLSPINVLAVGGISALILIALTYVIIAFTPLREYIPGYPDTEMRKQATQAWLRSDSLEMVHRMQTNYLRNVEMILQDSLVDTSDVNLPDSTRYQNLDLAPSASDSALREQVESDDLYNIGSIARGTTTAGIFFFTPIEGSVSSSFEPEHGHYGVDIAARENEAIKAVLEGVVVFSDWTSSTGYVIAIQHSQNLLSVYKHNSANVKKIGEKVQAGEVIAIVGESGSMSSGPHLHFELWENGVPVDPQKVMKL